MKLQTKTPGALKSLNEDLKEELAQLKHKYNVMKGQYYRLYNGEVVDADLAEKVQGSKDVASNVPDLLNNAALHLPKGIAGIAKNPMVQGWLTDLAKKYPTEASQMLGKYLPQVAQIAQNKIQTVRRL